MDMFNKLRNAVTSALPGNPLSKDFDVLNHIASGGPGLVWKIYNGIKKTTKQEAAVFVFEKKILEKYSKRDRELILETLKKGVSQLTRLRHPKILSVLHPLEESRENLAFATEPVFSSLANVLNKHDNMPNPMSADFKEYKLFEVEIKHGLLQVAEGLAFLHNDVKMVHCNICPESIIINKNGAWKIAGFDCCIPNSNQHSDPSFANAEPVFPCKEWDPELPTIVQPNLDYLAPEFALTMSCCRGSDMFSLAVLVHAIFNYGKPLYECNNQLSMFRKYSEELRKFRSSLLGNVPSELHEYIKLLLNTEPSVRPDADQITKIPYFEDVGSMTLQFMDTLFQIDNLQKSQFFKGLPKIIEKLPKRVNLQRILPALSKECVNADMIPFVLPSILLMAEQSTDKEYMTVIFPEFKPMFKIKEPVQILLLFMQNMNLLLKKTPQSEIKNHVLPMIYQALEQNSPQLQEICLNIIPTFAELIEFSALKSHILPRIKKICLSTSTLKIRVHCLLSLGKLLEHMDKWTVLDDILPFLPQIPSKEPAVLMSVLGIYQVAMSHAKLGITKDIMATKVLPFLIPLSIDNNINLSQFNAFFGVIREMLTKVEQEHRSKLEQLDQMKKEQSTIEITQLTGKENEQLVGNVGQGSQSMMDKFLSGFGMSGLMNSKSGGDNSSTASPINSRSNSPKPPPAQPAKSLSLEEKQRLAKEQEQQRMYKSQSPLTLKSDTKTSNTKPAGQAKDLTSSLMNSNLMGVQASAKSSPNYQPMGQTSMATNFTPAGQKPQNSMSGYSAMGQSGNRPNYSSGGMMGNMPSGGGMMGNMSSGLGYSGSGQFGGQQTTQKMNMSAFDSLLPSSTQPKPSLSQMSSGPRPNNPSLMNFNSQQNMTGSNFNASANFNSSSNMYGGFQQPTMSNMQSGPNMGGSAMFNNQQNNPMNSQNPFRLQPMGAQQFKQSQPAKQLGQSDLDDLLG